MFARVVVQNQPSSLTKLAELVREDSLSELVRKTALQIKVASGCRDRDDWCELSAIYDTVKHGDSRVPALKTGLKYVNDPQTHDYFIRPRKMLELCLEGASAEDCDSHAALNAALAAALGFRVGVRAYGPQKNGPLTHVYAVAIMPKLQKADEFGNPTGENQVVALDTTHPPARLGWEPPPGRVLTAWILPSGGVKVAQVSR